MLVGETMADKTVNIALKISSDGSAANELKLAKQIESTYASINKQAGTTGSRAVAAKAAPGMTGAAYGAGRGAIGTGASARDFAKESQGLGGLVRLYATWAANIYAVSAAFNALSSAANTTNMIKGMDQLGASSGIALGSLAKKFADATGGAISLQDAMSATTKAMSSGLSVKQFEQLGEVATKASRALGVNMADAVSRLTRGITKIEPELLDELGLFTKVGQAADEYAKRVGKSASSLSDFEKRQAFTNAVLKEGQDKFSGINVEANPYDKLAASMKNLTQTGLALINTVLGPIINLLSSSPAALSAVMTGLGVMLLKQAIPAIGEYRQSLDKATDETTKKWQKKSDDLKKIEKGQFQYILNLSEQQADSKLASFERAEQRIAKSRAKSILNNKAQEILAKTDPATVNKNDLKYLRDTARLEKASGNKALAKDYFEAARALEIWVKAEQEHLVLLKQIDAQVDKGTLASSPLGNRGYARDQLERARKSKAGSTIVSNVAEDASMGTFGEAWKKMNTSIKDEKLTGASKIFTKVSGAVVLATTGITRLMSALSAFTGWVGMTIAVLTTLYSWVSTNREEADKLSSALDYAGEVTKTATSTFEKFNNTLSYESLVAKSNAMSSLAGSVKETTDRFDEFNKASGTIDKAWESTKRLFGLFGGFSKQDYLAESLAPQIMSMLNSLEDPETRKLAEGKLKNLLSIKEVNLDGLTKSIKTIDSDKLKQIPRIVEEIGTKSAATVAGVTALKEGFKEVDTSILAIQNSLIAKDPISNLATAIAKQAKNMEESFKLPGVAVATLIEISNDASKLNMFPPESRAQIQAAVDDYSKLNIQIAAYKKTISDLDAQIKSEKKKIIGKSLFTIADLENKKAQVQTEINVTEASRSRFSDVLKTAANAGLGQAFKIQLSAFNSAAAQAAINTQKTLLGYLPKSEGTIKIQTDLENRSIDIRIKEIQQLFQLTQELKISRATKTLEDLKAKPVNEKNPEALSQRNKEISDAEATLKTYTSSDLAGAIKRGEIPKSQEALSELQVRSGINKQIEGLLGDKKNNKLKEAIDIYSTKLDKESKDIESSLRLKDIARKSETESSDYLRLTEEQRAESNKKYAESTEDDRRSLATAESVKSILIGKRIKDSPLADSALTKEATSAMGVGEKQFSDAVRLFNITNDITKTTEDRATQSAIINRDYDSQGRISELVLSATTQTYDINKQALDQSQALLDLKQSSSAITQNDYDQQTRLNKLEGIRLDTAQQLSLAIAEYVKKSDTLNREVDLGVASPTRLAEINQERAATLLYFTQGREKVIAFGAAQIDQVNATYEMSTTMKGFAKIVEDSFLNMGDALVEFAKTGKLDFAGLINSMIADLARFAIRASMQSAFNSANSTGTGIGSFISTIGNFLTGTTAGPEQLSGPGMQAKGGAWDAGIQKFALGGSFTNSIVNSPTLFKFAKGTGMMGEAGPEAIMPLKRDSQGNLGVRAGGTGGEVFVVVNNYSTSEAQTKETTDSNGNRRIEVTIADIVAKEVGRANSSINSGMKANFNIQPNLVRR